MEKLALTKQFIKEYKEQDLAFGGKLNLCDLNIIKSYLGFYFITHGFFGGVDGGGVKTMVQNYFRNRRYEVIFSLKSQGKDVCQICGITGLRDGQVRKCFKTPENQIEIYKIFESEWQGKPKEEITMKKPMNYDETQAGFTERAKAEVGGHYLKILVVQEMKNKNGGDMIMVGYDFAEHDKQAKMYLNEFNANPDTDKKWPIGGRNYMNVYDRDDKCSRSFKGFCSAVERSNPGFVIDWSAKDWGLQFKNKLVGCVYGNVENEYNGKNYMRSQLRWFMETQNVASAKTPKDKYLNGDAPAQTPQQVIDDVDLPF